MNKLTWNVYIGNFNSRMIERHNVFDHGGLMRDLGKVVRKLQRDKEHTEEEKKAIFAEELRKDMMYYYWSKCEWEVVIQHWPQSDSHKDLKVDVYDQVSLNWNHFLEYCWENRKEFARVKA